MTKIISADNVKFRLQIFGRKTGRGLSGLNCDEMNAGNVGWAGS